MLFYYLLSACLHRKITLGECNLFLAGITVLGDEIAGIAGEKDVFYGFSPPFGTGIDLLASTK